MRPLFSAETRRRLQENNPKWRIKAILQAICIFLSFIALILFAHVTAIMNQYLPSWDGDWTDWMALFPVLISLIFNTLALAFLFRGKLIHPGWDVTAHLITWTLGIPSMVVAVLYMWVWFWRPTYDYYPSDEGYDLDTSIGCYRWNWRSEACVPVIYTAGRIEIAANVFLGLLIIFSFTLFVLACIATHKYRRAARRSRVGTHNIQLQYHRSPEEHAAHQPPLYTPRSDEEQAVPAVTKYL
ncbi:MAG: hypothetical protein Q9208_003790 [Pyrenodesmia sp. 3 TL-2023]